ncbi:hypothetical protein AB6A40_003362 [Gnathostoma spinigerum]|uniref:DNA-directed RNA polymerase III subunit RPC6 n=1 Tax=Gnathostoma spinigerum TaxID=75299 RepID=A0ABD6E9H1_9BILA
MVKGEFNEAESEILSILNSTSSEQISNEDLMKATPDMNGNIRGEAVNSLLASGKIEMLPGNTPGAFFLRLKKGTHLSEATAEEQLIFSLIEESDKMGIWIRDIRDRTGLSQAQLRKALKSLEQRKLVKSVKAVGTTKKCYMLYDIEADESLTGGTFFSDQQLDSQFVQTLVHLCVAMLQSKRRLAEENNPKDPTSAREFSFVRPMEVANFVKEKGVCRVTLTVADVESILAVAVLDGCVERRADGMYRALRSRNINSALAYLPCIHCTVASDCKPGHVISPETCQYFSSWLEQS